MADQVSQFVPFDLDTGGATEYILGVGLRLSSSGGSVEAKAQTTMALSIPVAIASDQGALNVSAATVTVTDDGSFTLAANSGVDIGDVDVTSILPGVGATNLGKAIDTAVGATDTGVLSLAVRDDVLGGLTPAANDVVSMFTDANGALWTHDNNFPLAAALTDNFANPTVPGVGAFALNWDGSTWDRVLGNSTDGLLVNLGGNNDITATALDIRALSEATDQVLVFANTVKDGSGTDLVPLVDADGHLQLDVLTGGGSDTPSNPTVEPETGVDTATAAEENLTGSEAAAKKLAGVDVWCSQRYKFTVHTVDNAVESGILGIGGGDASQGVPWRPPHRDYVQLGTTAGLDAFRVIVTNLGNLPADTHAVIYAED